MTWKKISCVIRRLRFAKEALKAQRNMSAVCRKFGYSRRTGYKWVRRFVREGMRGLRDQSRRPRRFRGQTSLEWLVRIRRLRRRHPSWGSKKLAACLRREFGRGSPCIRTVGKWLQRMGLSRRGRRRTKRGPQLRRSTLTVAKKSNQVWTVDFKGWFRTRDGRRVEPLTVRDLFSRYILSIRLLKDQSWKPVRREFQRLFGRYGYPQVIRMDNGSPFGSTGPMGLSRLSAWWRGLSIQVEFIAPGHPEQNAGHEQMHGVFKKELTARLSPDRRAQQRRTSRWIKTYNEVRPNEALGQRTPVQLYRFGKKETRQIVLRYPKGWEVRRVRSNGQIKWHGRKRFIGEAFVGYPIGLKEGRAGKVQVFFGTLLIGHLWEGDLGAMRPANYVRRPGR